MNAEVTANTDDAGEEKKEEKERLPFLEAARKVLLASIGAMALAQEEMEDFVNKLIERGEIAEKDGKKLVHELVEKRRKRSQEAEEEVARRVRETLDRMSIPTKADFEKLSASITALAQKIDELKQTRK
jgi:poly(hydroxyalkanoate) granule-associated protein